MRIGFIWQGVSDPYIFQHWKDGLYAAMNLVHKEHEVKFMEPWDDFTGMDLLLYWEAPCTINGKNADFYNKVRNTPIKKALLFAGGPLKKEWVEGFDLLFVESEINAQECISLGIPYMKAFGINTDIFKPQLQAKVFDGVHHGTFAGWKHQPLIAEALKEKALLVGAWQEHEKILYEQSQKFGAMVLPKVSYRLLPYLISSAYTCVNMADVWGGGQRTTLEAMACGVPVVCRTDSPKNMEFIQESGFGEIISPSKEQIQLGVGRLKEKNLNPQIGIDYINSKWTHIHYAKALLDGINSIHNNT